MEELDYTHVSSWPRWSSVNPQTIQNIAKTSCSPTNGQYDSIVHGGGKHSYKSLNMEKSNWCLHGSSAHISLVLEGTLHITKREMCVLETVISTRYTGELVIQNLWE